jgi:hypothetical protein
MNIKPIVHTVFLILLLPLFLHAQEPEKQKEPKQIVEQKVIPEKPKPSFIGIYFETEGYHFDNSDFTNYNQNRYEENQSVDFLNTDDEINFLYSTLGMHLTVHFKSSSFYLDLYRSGFWGNDNLEGKDEGGNDILFRKLYFIYNILPKTVLSFGRQPYSIGHTLKDYFFSDTIDGVILSYAFNDDAALEFTADITGIASKPDTYLFSSIEKDDKVTDDFQGETYSLRYGVNLRYRSVKLFGYYLKYGASAKGGADISENGDNQTNRPDGDFLVMNGVRFFFKNEGIQGDFSLVYSYGKDYQFERERDYNGFAGALNLRIQMDPALWAGFGAGYFHPGFCSMKGNSMGGLLLYAYKGYFPSAYAGAYHFKDFGKYEIPTETDRTVSKTFFKGEIQLKIDNWKFFFSGMPLWETEKTASLSYMGSEGEFRVETMAEHLKIEFISSVFVPSDYYEKRHGENPFLPAGNDPFYGFSLKVTYFFNFPVVF